MVKLKDDEGKGPCRYYIDDTALKELNCVKDTVKKTSRFAEIQNAIDHWGAQRRAGLSKIEYNYPDHHTMNWFYTEKGKK